MQKEICKNPERIKTYTGDGFIYKEKPPIHRDTDQ